MENKGFDFNELEKTLDALKTKLTDLEKKIDDLKVGGSTAGGGHTQQDDRPHGPTHHGPDPQPGHHFGQGFPFDNDFPGTVRDAVSDALGTVMPGRESQRTTRDFQVSGFTGIEVGGTFQVDIVRGDTYSVSIIAEEELFGNLDVSRDGNLLRIRHSRHIGWRAQLTKPQAKITLPVLKELRLSGASKATFSGFNSPESFRLELSGASSLGGDIACGDAEIELSGASRAKITGSARNVLIEASGANHADLGAFTIHDAAVRLGGASHVALKMDGKLDARLNGVSHLTYIGNPMMGNIRTSGAARLSRE